MNAAVELQAVHKRYGAVHALRGIDLEVQQGEVFGFIGPNGAGKTTTMRILLDLLRPSEGRVRVLGQDPQKDGAALRARIGYLPGELRVNSRHSVASVLAYLGRLARPAQSQWQEIAERLQLDLSRKVCELSRGNKQKLGLVQAFAHQPELLILDEPTSGLDPIVQQEFAGLVKAARANGQTVFLSSHVLSEIEHLAERITVLRKGEVAMTATVSQLRAALGLTMRIGFATAPTRAILNQFAQLPQVRTARSEGHQIVIELDGSPDAVIKQAAKHVVTDLTAERPDLEAAVLGLYEEQK